MTATDSNEVLDAWQPAIEQIDDWQILVGGIVPKPTGCGPVSELDNLVPNRPNESFAIADMRDMRITEPHYHPDGPEAETEIYLVLQGLGLIVVGGKEQSLQKGTVIVTPPDTTHFIFPKSDLVLAVINTPPFKPENYVPVTESNPDVGFDLEQFSRLVEEAYRQRGLVVERGRDEPGKVYEPHRHEKTYLYTIGGSIDVKLDGGETQTIEPLYEFIVGGNQLHEAVVGSEGWDYIAAWDAVEAQNFQH